MHLTAADIAARAGGTVVGDPGALVTSWTFDSRAAREGSCFVALRGHRDGHDFVADAFRAGARVALVDRAVPHLDLAARALVHTGDALRALQDVAASVRRDRADLRVVAVTGSTGKTSTKDLLAAALASAAVHANPESYNNEFGLPITLLDAPPGTAVVVTEMGERFPGDIAALCRIARPRYGIVTNVGLAHAEHLGGPEGVAAVLGELLEALPPDGVAVLDADDPWSGWLASRTAATVRTVGFGERADHRISRVEVDARLRPSFELDGRRVPVPLRGAHQVVNAACAVVVAHHVLGLPWDDVVRDLQGARGARWRMEVQESATGVIVLNDAYNANPASMTAALHALAHVGVPGRRIAVLGDMRELGAHGDAAHAEAGRLASALGIDWVVGVGEGGARIVQAARAAGAEAEAVADATAAADLVAAAASRGDAVLVKASRALGLQAVAEHLLRVRAGR
ncbi:MAG: UDP-N-acetylmuramoyl-tripeptide--D-alanyl-D-alanine ligase [Acidimicrobiia bacterium]|nr:MAG: UDP-N-acetylmuramoyl-tripeptide--D-alanyl-D-alanine ligase [Acidimicrobiia bacterium]